MTTIKLLKFYVFIVLLALQNYFSNAIKCYSCGETSNVLYSSTSSNRHITDNTPLTVSCKTLNDHWNSTKDDINKYIIDCPAEYQGCITQIQGNEVTRTCDTYPMDDCQTANLITYCYCSYDLCNGDTNSKTITTINRRRSDEVVQTKLPSQTMSIINYKDMLDDEDYNIDMSGHGINDNENEHQYEDDNNKEEENITTSRIVDTTFVVEEHEIILTNSKTNSIKKPFTNATSDLEENLIAIDGDGVMTTTKEYSGKHLSIITSTVTERNKSNSFCNFQRNILIIVGYICLKLS